MTETPQTPPDGLKNQEKQSKGVELGSLQRKLYKLSFLFIWMGGLGLVSFLTITGFVNDFLEKQIQRKTYNDWKNDKQESLVDDVEFKKQYESSTAQQSYNLYREQQFKVNEKLSIQVGQPPIEAILDLATNKNWRNENCRYHDIGTFATFDRIERILIALSTSPEIFEGQEITSVSAIIPSQICLNGATSATEGNGKNPPQETEIIVISPEIRSWINQEITYRTNRQKAINLFDTFILLSILGAFGSMIFLINDFMSGNKETRRPIFEYALKPAFGMFLAIATFVIAIGANGVLNPSNALSVNSQFIYLLGLGSGLLSDKAYKHLIERLSTVFDKPEDEDILQEQQRVVSNDNQDDTLEEQQQVVSNDNQDDTLQGQQQDPKS